MKRPVITSVNALCKYRLSVRFKDGTNGTYDVSHLAGKGIFKRWDEDEIFFKVFISPDSGAITWPGEMDIDTINVYCALKNIAVNDFLKPALQHAKD